MIAGSHEPMERRPIRSREIGAFRSFASWLARHGASPNAISILSVVFGIGAGIALAATGQTEAGLARVCWLAGAALIQLRLLANMFDGMVAIESRRASPVGELFNEAPDRISDVAIMIGAGYASGGSVMLGFAAAIMALMIAYVRALGASAGAGQAFQGPMAKPQRMFLLTIVCLYIAATPLAWRPVHEPSGWGVTAAALIVILLGGLVTIIRRFRFIADSIREHSS